MIDKQLLEILVCPQCKQALSLVDGGRGLVCSKCQLKYAVRDDIPIMLVEEAQDLKGGVVRGRSGTSNLPRATFKVVQGTDAGLTFQVEQRSCRAIGRGETDLNKTMMFNVDLALSLDEGTKTLVLHYIQKQFRAAKGQPQAEAGEHLGLFRRAPDIVLTDHSLSRLHAMILADEGQVGILDLVSKNGTFVNGQEVESRLLQKGDAVEMGETKIIFEG